MWKTSQGDEALQSGERPMPGPPRESRAFSALLVLILSISGCAGLPRHVQKSHTEALQAPESTTLGRIVNEGAVANLSGIRLLLSGDEAFASLIALADRAERTLDIQYYIIHEDNSARVLLHHV